MILSHHKTDMTRTTSDNLIRCALVSAIGFPLTLCINHIHERIPRLHLMNKILNHCLGITSLVLYYSFLLKAFNSVSITRYAALSIVLYLIFMFTPYYYTRSNFELYIVKLLSRFLATVLYAGVMFLGISAILFTLNELLKFNISSKTYFDLFLIITGIFSPCFFLAGVPLLNTELSLSDYPKLLKILLIYIVIPLLTTYTVILYIYFGKIIFTLQWPVQLVMHLVLWYSLISTIVIFLTTIFVAESNLVKFFTKWATKLLLPLLIMLFVSVGKRIHAYGITEPRYFVIVLGLWVMGIMLYYILSRNPRNIVLPITLAIVAAICVVGPLSAYSVSKYSQNLRLKSILTKYHMLSGNSIVKSKQELSEYDKVEISQILNYFSNYHQLRDVNYLSKNFKIVDMENTFGFPSQSNTGDLNQSKYFSYNLTTPQYPIAITGYDYFINMNGSEFIQSSEDKKFTLSYDNVSGVMRCTYNNKVLGVVSVHNYAKVLSKKLGNATIDIKNPKAMTYKIELPQFNAKMIFIQVSGHNDVQRATIKIDYINFYFLIKIK